MRITNQNQRRHAKLNRKQSQCFTALCRFVYDTDIDLRNVTLKKKNQILIKTDKRLADGLYFCSFGMLPKFVQIMSHEFNIKVVVSRSFFFSRPSNRLSRAFTLNSCFFSTFKFVEWSLSLSKLNAVIFSCNVRCCRRKYLIKQSEHIRWLGQLLFDENFT